MGIGVGEPTGQQHLVGGEAGPRDRVVRLESCLLHFGVVVGDIAVQGERADIDEGVVAVWPDLGEVEGVEPVGHGGLEGHDLHLERPAGALTAVDGLIEIALVVVGVLACDSVRIGLGEALTPWSDLKWYFTQKRSPSALTHM
jgi:hypothetical protein